MNLFKRLFSKRAKENTGSEVNEIINGLLQNELATQNMQNDAKMVSAPSAILTPAIPLQNKEAVGWFAGTPKLPKELSWPEIEGTPLCFIAQIDLTQIPQNIWSGVGPRKGQFAFFIHPTEMKAKVLHVHGPLEKRQGPTPDPSALWPRKHPSTPLDNNHFTEWPVLLTAHSGELPEPAGWCKGKAPNFQKPFKNEGFDLTNQAHHPFDEATLRALIEQIDKELERKLRSIETLLTTKKLKDDITSALEALQIEVLGSQKTFLDIKKSIEPYQKVFDQDGIVPHMHTLNSLISGHTTYHRNDDEGYAEIEVSSGKLIQYVSGFLPLLGTHAKYAYLETPEKLTAKTRVRFETIWAFDALHERGGMSHPPKGFIYTPHGSSSPNEILLELPTSSLIGWMWGDMNSIVLTVPRDDLANGKLDNILVDITN